MAPEIDNAPILRFIIHGAPRTKKNHGWRTKTGRQMPSKAFAEWNKQAQMWLMTVRVLYRDMLPIDKPVNCRALFYRDAERGDAVGYYQALADALQEARIVEDDKLIVSWDGSRLSKDAEGPRIWVELWPATPA